MAVAEGAEDTVVEGEAAISAEGVVGLAEATTEAEEDLPRRITAAVMPRLIMGAATAASDPVGDMLRHALGLLRAVRFIAEQ